MFAENINKKKKKKLKKKKIEKLKILFENEKGQKEIINKIKNFLLLNITN